MKEGLLPAGHGAEFLSPAFIKAIFTAVGVRNNPQAFFTVLNFQQKHQRQLKIIIILISIKLHLVLYLNINF
jgi:hypothetical protein